LYEPWKPPEEIPGVEPSRHKECEMVVIEQEAERLGRNL
jgi:hypothetical protein